MDPNYRETKTERRKKAIESKIKTSLRPTVRLRYKKGKEGIPREKTPRQLRCVIDERKGGAGEDRTGEEDPGIRSTKKEY